MASSLANAQLPLQIEGTPAVGGRLNVTLKHASTKPFNVRPQVLAWSDNGKDGGELRWRGSLPIPGLFMGEHYFRILPGASQGSTRLEHGQLR